MRQKKSNLIYYALAAVILAAVAFVIVHEVPMEVTHVEEPVNLDIQ